MRKHIVVFNMYLFLDFNVKNVNYYLYGDLLILNVSYMKVNCFRVKKKHILKENIGIILIVDYINCIFYFHMVE
jgi:hypothetical protein